MTKTVAVVACFWAVVVLVVFGLLISWGIIQNGRSEQTTREVKTVCIQNGGQLIKGDCVKTAR